MLYLKEINDKDIEKEYIFVRDMPIDENGLTNKWNNVTYEDFKNKALKEMIAFSKEENLPDGYVPQTFFFLWNDDEIVGQFRIRYYLCESLKTGAGHIGYFIKKEFRGKGFAKEGLRMTIEIARSIIPENDHKYYVRIKK